MTKHSDRIRERLAFDDSMTWDEKDALDPLDRACLRGEYLENARTRPLIELLCEAVDALERIYAMECPYGEGGCDSFEKQNIAVEVLNNIRREVER